MSEAAREEYEVERGVFDLKVHECFTLNPLIYGACRNKKLRQNLKDAISNIKILKTIYIQKFDETDDEDPKELESFICDLFESTKAVKSLEVWGCTPPILKLFGQIFETVEICWISPFNGFNGDKTFLIFEILKNFKSNPRICIEVFSNDNDEISDIPNVLQTISLAEIKIHTLCIYTSDIHWKSIRSILDKGIKIHVKKLVLNLWNGREFKEGDTFFDILSNNVTFDKLEVRIRGRRYVIFETRFFLYILKLLDTGFCGSLSIDLEIQDFSQNRDLGWTQHYEILSSIMKKVYLLQKFSVTNLFDDMVSDFLGILGVITATSKNNLKKLTFNCDRGTSINVPELYTFLEKSRIEYILIRVPFFSENKRATDAFRKNFYIRELVIENANKKNEIIEGTEARKEAFQNCINTIITMMCIKKYKGHHAPKEIFKMLGESMLKMWAGWLYNFNPNIAW